MRLGRAVDLDNHFTAGFLVQKIDILGDHRLEQTPAFQGGEHAMDHRGLFFVEIIDKIPGRPVIKGRILPKHLYVEYLFGVQVLVQAVFPPEIPDARKGGHPRAGKGDAVPGFLYEIEKSLGFGVHVTSIAKMDTGKHGADRICAAGLDNR
jgi:hypothetical protein